MTLITPVDGQDAVAEHVAQLTETLTGVRSEPITLASTLAVSGAATFASAPTVGGSPLLTAPAADALFLTPAEGTAAYAAAGHTHAALYEPLDSAYTKAESDTKYALASALTAAVARIATLEGQVTALLAHAHANGTVGQIAGPVTYP